MGGFELYAYVHDTNGWIDIFGLSKTYVQENEVLPFNDFRKKSKVGDNLEGHEVLQNAILKQKGLTNKRLDTDASKKNPVIALNKDVHTKINKSQIEKGTKDMSVKESINVNSKILIDNGVPKASVDKIKADSIQHAKDLKIY